MIYGQMVVANLSVAANAVSTNQLSGQLYEFLQRPSLVRYRASASATGLNQTLIAVPLPGPVVNDQGVSTSNRFPQLPEDLVVQFPAGRGVRLVLTFRNTTGAALTVNGVVEVLAVR